MNTYNFEMKSLLTLFNNDPEALANEFTKQLNAELAKEKALSESKTKVCESWNSFLKTYFEYHPIPKDMEIQDFYINESQVDNILNWILGMIPHVENMTANIQKIKDSCVPMAKDLSAVFKDWVNNHTQF